MMLTALKWTGTSVTVGSLVAAITVRVIAGGAGLACPSAEVGSVIAPSNSSPVVLTCTIASQVNGSSEHHTLSHRLLEWQAASTWFWTETGSKGRAKLSSWRSKARSEPFITSGSDQRRAGAAISRIMR